jgi:hypothetical protein
MTPKTKYIRIHISINDNTNIELRKECFALRISKQEFIRSLLRDYFIRRKGIDTYLNTREALRDDNNI